MIPDGVVIGYSSVSHNTTCFRPYWYDKRLQKKLAETNNARLGRAGGLTSAHVRGSQGGRGRGAGKRGGGKRGGSKFRGRGRGSPAASPKRPQVNAQQVKPKGGKKPQARAVSPDQDPAIAAKQQEAAELQRKASESQRELAALQKGDHEPGNKQRAVSAAVVNKRPGSKQRKKKKRDREAAAAAAEAADVDAVEVASFSKAPKTGVGQHVTGPTYAQKAISLRMAQPVMAVFAHIESPLCIARVATETLYYMYGHLLPSGKRYRVEHSMVCMTVKHLHKCGYLYCDSRHRYARTDKNCVCVQDEELEKTTMTTSPVTTTNRLRPNRRLAKSPKTNEHKDDELEIESTPASLEQCLRFLEIKSKKAKHCSSTCDKAKCCRRQSTKGHSLG